MRFALASLGLLLSLPAYAGGLGLIATGGTHTEALWYHANVETGTDGALAELNDIADFPKYETTQTILHTGAGLELVLGDRDERVQGSFRFYYLGDAPQRDPAIDNEPGLTSDQIVSSYRDEVRPVGMASIGLSWMIIGSGDFRVGPVAHVGSGFLTTDHTEFLAVNAGPGVSWRLNRALFLNGDVSWQMRYNKRASHGVNTTLGLRYMFD